MPAIETTDSLCTIWLDDAQEYAVRHRCGLVEAASALGAKKLGFSEEQAAALLKLDLITVSPHPQLREFTVMVTHQLKFNPNAETADASETTRQSGDEEDGVLAVCDL